MGEEWTRQKADEWFDRLFSGGEERQYVGLTVENATALARQNRVEHGPRLLDAGGTTRILANHMSNRLNFVIEDGRVIRAGFF